VLGALQAVKCLTGRAADPLLHLRAMNPHVAGVLGSAGSPAPTCAARQVGPALNGGEMDGHCLGVSSFAFQVQPAARSRLNSSYPAQLVGNAS